MTVLIAVELKKLECEGFGVYIDKNRMENDKIFPSRNCFAAFVKKDILDLPDKFFDMTRTGDCTREMYVTNYDKDMDLSLKKVAAVYHPDKHRLTISLETNMSESNNFFFIPNKSIRDKYSTYIYNNNNYNFNFCIFLGSASNKIRQLHMERRRKHGYVTPPRTALDELGSELRREKEQALASGFVSDDIVGSEEDIEDVVFQHAILPDRTGNFDLDFPESPRISKGKGKTSESAAKNTSPKLNATVPISASEKSRPNAKRSKGSPCRNNAQEEGANNDLDVNGNIRPSGFATVQRMDFASKFVSDSDRDTTDVDDIPEKTAGKKYM